MTPYQERRAKIKARARELRAQHLTFKQIVEIMTAEGLQISEATAWKYTRDIDTPEHRGRAPVYQTNEARAEARRRYKREYWHRHKERITQERREALANESEEERAERLEYQRLVYQQRTPEQQERRRKYERERYHRAKAQQTPRED